MKRTLALSLEREYRIQAGGAACPRCAGDAKLLGVMCRDCDGTGYLSPAETDALRNLNDVTERDEARRQQRERDDRARHYLASASAREREAALREEKREAWSLVVRAVMDFAEDTGSGGALNAIARARTAYDIAVIALDRHGRGGGA